MNKIKRIIALFALTAVLVFSGMLAPVASPYGTISAEAAVKLNKTKLKLTVGDSFKLKLKGTDQKVTWKTNDKTVASVTKKGVVKAKNEGTATISAKTANKTYKCKVTVEEIVEVPNFTSVTIPDSEALDFTYDMRIGWNLGNTFDANDCTWLSDDLAYETGWQSVKTTETTIKGLSDAGIKTVRVPVSWHNHVDANYTINSAWLNRVKEVVDYCYKYDMYVILNIHHDNSADFMYPSADKLDQSKKYVSAIWKQLADAFADYDEHLIFEALNEPRLVGTNNEWWLDPNSDLGSEAFDCLNQLNQTIVDTIRNNSKGYNRSRYILVTGYAANPGFTADPKFVIPSDSKCTKSNRILIMAHSYSPYNFALNTSGTDKFSMNDSYDVRDIDNCMKQLYERYVSKGIGVVIDEFGCVNKNNIKARNENTAYFVARARNYGITCCWWDNNGLTGEGFRILDRTTGKFVFPSIVDQMVYYSEKR